MRLSINKDKIVPNISSYILIIISAFITTYVFQPLITKAFPFINDLDETTQFIIWVIIIVYSKELISLRIRNREVF